MEEYIKKIEQIAARCTESQSDGYSQIMRICDAMREEQKYCLGYVSKKEYNMCDCKNKEDNHGTVL